MCIRDRDTSNPPGLLSDPSVWLSQNEERIARSPNKPDPGLILQGGDNCSDPLDLGNSLPIYISGTTEGYTNDYGPYTTQPSCWQGEWGWGVLAGGPDVTYKWTAPEDDYYTFDLTDSYIEFRSSLILFQYTCDTGEPTYPDDVICAANGGISSDHAKLNCVFITQGQEVLVVVDGLGNEFDSGPYTLSITKGEPVTGACCVDGECVATNQWFECRPLGGYWFEGEDCAAFECPDDHCVDAIYQNGEPDWMGGMDAYRYTSGGDPFWVVDDVTFETDVEIQGFHWVCHEYNVGWLGLADIIILADPNGEPGDTIVEMYDVPCTRMVIGYMEHEDENQPICIYSIEGQSISLAGGFYWIGLRPVVVDLPGRGGSYWVTAPLTGSGY